MAMSGVSGAKIEKQLTSEQIFTTAKTYLPGYVFGVVKSPMYECTIDGVTSTKLYARSLSSRCIWSSWIAPRYLPELKALREIVVTIGLITKKPANCRKNQQLVACRGEFIAQAAAITTSI